MYTLGVDIGSASSKAVILQDGERIVSKAVIPLGTGTAGPAQVYEKVFSGEIRPSDISYSIVTGYGRMNFDHADRQISELSCHAAGVRLLIPGTRTVIDIGGQDAKVLRISHVGKLQDFVMNDKCAAGTGRFLEVMARILNVDLKDMGELSAKAVEAVNISSTCTVFAETEVISRLSEGKKVPDILAGVHASVARRVAGLALRVGLEDKVAMSGGVALNGGIVRAMETELKLPVQVHPDCQLAGAIGAAVLAWQEAKKESGQL